jgi:GAF domain-containing protein/HAMP domain-containing protein/PAS domain-containing protein
MISGSYSMEHSQIISPETKQATRNAIVSGIIAALILGGLAFYAAVSNAASESWSILPLFFAALILIWLSATGRHILGSIFFITIVAIQIIISPLIERGLGIPNAVGGIALIGTIGLATLPREYSGRVLIAGILAGVTGILLDLFGSVNRPEALTIDLRWIFSSCILFIFIIVFIQKFAGFDIRTKIVLGILATGGVALGVFALFAVGRAGRIADSLSQRLETSVSLLAEEQLVNTLNVEADLVDHFFDEITEEVEGQAEYRISLQAQQASLSQGTYWNAQTNLYQLPGGQFGNSTSDPSSVFIPVNTELDEAIFAELNTSAYLDFSVPSALEANPSILAIYYIHPRGMTRYYPNINLASLLPPDFDATKRPYYEITSPLFNPNRQTRWTIPYVDAAGGGLVVTVASPVYVGDQFNGVVAADIQLSEVTEQVGSITIGQTGYALMIDDAGRIISMPPAGYQMFGINPEEFSTEEFFKQTILGEGPEDLGSVVRRMVVGGTGLNIIDVNGVDTYIGYLPIEATGYSIALVVPVSEMQGAIITARTETQNQIRSATQLAAIIFITLLLFAILISFGIGRVIATPVVRLTDTANKIVAGDLTAQANVGAQDEVGTLAQAFNTMTSRLRETLAGLEQRVQDRTAELLAANEKIERRAKQFATISEISRVINQTQGLQDLLPQITQAISQQFNFYHVGIFLLDANKEYAVLAATNSEGGQRMLGRNHKLKVGLVGIVGNVAGAGLPRIALDTGADASYFNNPDLPETHSEMALPLFRAGREIIGVLDVQSTEVNAFGPEDIQILATLAEQVSVAISNARLYEETQKALVESEMVYRAELRSGWQKFAKSLNLAGIRRRGTRSVLLSEPLDLPGVESVSRTGNVYEVKAENNRKGSQITLPVKLRGEVVGVLSLGSDESREWSSDELDIISAIVERAALSIESSRLLSESQKQAAKERAIGEIAARVSSYTNRDNILQAAVTEIGRALPGTEIIIQLEHKNGKGNQS